MNEAFCRRLRQNEFLLGTFVKLHDPTVMEILARTALDFVVIDAEHAPLGRQQIGNLLLAAKAVQLPALVRVPEGTKTWFSTALDAGACGVMVPHVSTPDQARQLTMLMGFGRGGRGFSPSTRAAGYGVRGIADHLARQPGETALICQIEDRQGVENAEAIARMDGVDGLFVGPVDLAVSLGHTSVTDSEVGLLAEQTCHSAIQHGKVAGIFVPGAAAARSWQHKAGVTLAIVGTDQSFLTTGASAALSAD